MKNLEKPLTWLLGIAFIAYIGISNMCSEKNNNAVLENNQANINMPVMQKTECNLNLPVLERAVTEEVSEDIESDIADTLINISDSAMVETEPLESEE